MQSHEIVERLFTGDLVSSSNCLHLAGLTDVVGSSRAMVTISNVGVGDFLELFLEEC